MKKPIYREIACRVLTIENCKKTNNAEWQKKHTEFIKAIIKNEFPSGSGIDCGVKFDFEKSNANKLVFTFSYHFMNQSGFYVGWQDYSLIVRPNLALNVDVIIMGKNKNNIKDYFYDIFNETLFKEIDINEFAKKHGLD